MNARPRHYAVDIVRLQSKEDREAYIAKLPDNLIEMVKTHVKNMWSRRNEIRASEKIEGAVRKSKEVSKGRKKRR